MNHYAGVIVSAAATIGMLGAALLAARTQRPDRHTAALCAVAVLWCVVITALVIGRN